MIINHNTRNVTFLALLSALRYTGVPVLLIDCQSTDGSFDFFTKVMSKYAFDLLSAPLKTHGLTLDWIFSATKDDKLLLIDSDLEILNEGIISFFNAHIDDPRIFGSSFLVGPKRIKDPAHRGTSFENALLYERPFIPLALFKVSFVKEALQSGISFNAVMVENEYGAIPQRFSRVIKRFMRTLRKNPPYLFRKRYFTSYPKRVYYDTGAKIYEYLRYDRFLFFVSLPRPCVEKYVNHFHGATRRIVNPQDKQMGDYMSSIDEIVAERLKNEYQESFNY